MTRMSDEKEHALARPCLPVIQGRRWIQLVVLEQGQ